MAINFPNTPVDGQQYTSGDITWQWSLAIGAWVLVPVSTSDANIAASAAASATATMAAFSTLYLGSKAANPAADNVGNPLVEGALYWNSTAKQMRVFNGVAWQAF